MLYPRVCISKKEISLIDRLCVIKDNLVSLVGAFRSYRAFSLFLVQKFHF